MSTLLRELRLAARSLRRAPLFTIAAIVTLALGIGANTAVFGVVRGLLLRPLPYEAPAQLVVVWGQHPSIGHETASLPDFVDWRSGNTTFEQLAAFGNTVALLTGSGDAERLDGALVTADLFTVLGHRPVAGRIFTDDEQRSNAAPTVLVSEGLWRRRFAADPALVGRSLTINGRARTVVGVVPNDIPLRSSPPDVFFPIALDTTMGRRADFLNVVGRLKPGVPADVAAGELNTIMARLEQEFPRTNTSWRADVVPLQREIVGDVRPALFAFSAAVALVLLIACANVANLFLARAAAREQELAVRVTLGASRSRLAAQLMAESVLLAGSGAVIGLGLAAAALGVLRNTDPPLIPRPESIQIDLVVLAFTVGIALLTALLFGLAPMLRIARGYVRPGLNAARASTGGAAAVRLRGMLVLGQVALALMLLVGAGLLIRSFDRLQRVSPGFEAQGVLTAQIAMPGSAMMDTTRVAGFWRDALAQLETTPGVLDAAYSSSPPMGGVGYWSFSLEGQPPRGDGEVQDVQALTVSRHYFSTLQIPLAAGRAFDASDVRGAADAVVVNREFVRRFSPDADPIGQRLTYGDPAAEDVEWYVIVGVVGDVVQQGLADAVYPQTYTVVDQNFPRGGYLVVRTSGDPIGMTSAVRAAVAAVEPNVALGAVATMEQRIARTVAQPRVSAVLLLGFALIALALAAIGIYGVMAYTTALRTREMGIRLALGSSPAAVLRLVVRQGMLPVIVGIVLGGLGALASGRILDRFLFDTGASDPATFVATASVLCAVALLACWIPAWRALGRAPSTLLRQD